MPRGDRTGPMGLGPMTGRGAGLCAGYPEPGFVNPGPGRGCGMGMGRGGWGRGRGSGGGWGRGAYAAPTPYAYRTPLTAEQQVDMLKQQAESLTQTQAEIRKRIEALESN